MCFLNVCGAVPVCFWRVSGAFPAFARFGYVSSVFVLECLICLVKSLPFWEHGRQIIKGGFVEELIFKFLRKKN